MFTIKTHHPTFRVIHLSRKDLAPTNKPLEFMMIRDHAPCKGKDHTKEAWQEVKHSLSQVWAMEKVKLTERVLNGSKDSYKKAREIHRLSNHKPRFKVELRLTGPQITSPSQSSFTNQTSPKLSSKISKMDKRMT